MATHFHKCHHVPQATRAALASEEPWVERLQAQLKELLVFPHHLQPLSESVVAAIQDYQRCLQGQGGVWGCGRACPRGWTGTRGWSTPGAGALSCRLLRGPYSLKAKSTRMRNAAGAQLWQRFQRPLQDLQLWRALGQRLLEVTANLPDLPSIHTFLPQIEVRRGLPGAGALGSPRDI